MGNNGSQRITIDVDINGHIQGFEQAVTKANQALKELKIDDKATQGVKDMFKSLQVELSKYQQLSQDALSGKNVASALNTSKNRIISSLKAIGKEYQSLGKGDIGFSDEIISLQKELDTLKDGLSDIGSGVANQFSSKILSPLKDFGTKMEAGQRHVNAFLDALKSGDPTKIAETFQTLDKYQKRFGQNNEQFKESYKGCVEANNLFNESLGSTRVEMANLEQRIQALSDQDLATLQGIVEKLGIDFNEFTNWLNQNADANIRLGGEVRQTEKEFDRLSSRIKQFFSLTNGFILFRRAVQGAFSTVKELDAVMTETAVVTDFSVSDMWDKLPEYTKMANELGATTKGAYETATLYYQQGLKTNEVMAVSAETMKMARIAGLDYATATDYMTAALRGFNMEINTDSAQRVNDVYSRLAAITASNTQEISVAMTKVASLAHNANMEFETTAAFLAQIIETTRESAETAGTALKTVVARFTEVKKLYNEGELMGTDEEGEEIDVNKVATALRSAGIDMNKYFTGLVGLDDIFMELASKWDSLDKVQQRYIATMAAGSRQQSRFIAMMSNYQRTLELVGEAQNSAGASQKQFDKTMESLEAKLNRLKNAWDSFLMGLANSDIIKSAVDWLTNLITKINELLSAMSGGSGIAKTFATLFAGLAGGAVAKGGLDLLTGGLFALAGRNRGEKQVKSSILSSLFSTTTVGEGEDAKDVGSITAQVMGLTAKFKGLKEGIGTVTDAINDFSLKGFKGLEGMGKALGELGTSFTSLMGSIGNLLVAIAPYALAIAAIVGVVLLIKNTIYEINNQDKILAEKAATLKESAAMAKEEISNTRNELEALEDKKKTLDEYITGTQEWRDALIDLNAEYKAFLEAHEDAKQFMSFDSKGNYVFDSERYQKYLASMEAKANNTETIGMSYSVDSSKAALENVLKGIDIKAYDDRYMKVSLSNEQKQQLYEDIIAGNVDASNYEEYIKGLGYTGIATKFEDVADSTVEVKNALFDLAQALNEYAKKFGLPTISEDEYDEAIEKTTDKYMEMSTKELEAIADNGSINEAYDKAVSYDDEGGAYFSKDLYHRYLAEAVAKSTALNFDSSTLSADTQRAYGSYRKELDASQQQTFDTNLNTLQEVGINITDKVLKQTSEYTKEGKDIQELIDSLLELMKIENSHEDNVKALKKQLDTLNIKATEEEIEKLAKAWEADEKQIKKMQNTIKDSPDDYEAIAKAASEAFDTEVTKEWVEENYDALQTIAEGGEGAAEAFEKLQQKLAFDNIVERLQLTEDEATNLGNIIADINNENVAIGGTADFSQIFTELANLLGSAEKAADFLESMGYETDWELKGYETVIMKGSYLSSDNTVHERYYPVQQPVYEAKVVKTGLGNTGFSGGGGGGGTGSSGGGGGGGGSDSNPDRWLNPYDKFYNLTEQINEALRQREKLERNYDRILKNRLSKQRDIQANTQARLNSLKQEIAMNRALLAGRQSQVDAVLNEKFLDDDKNIRTFREFGVGRYANYNTERGTIEIDWEGLERLSGTTDTQLGGIIEDYVSRLEELQKQFEDVDKTIEDLEDEVAEILDINKEEYLSFEQRVFEAIVDRQQKLIDNYSELSDTISNNDEEVLNALSESIDLSRQIRDNTKTEEEIAQKEARLAYLRRDTSGANDLAIKQLEKELEEARQSYGDTLVDQELDRLSQASEEAAKQRERQIEIMEAQLEWQQRVGFFWPEVIDLLQNNYGELDEGISDALMNLLKNTDAFSGMSEYQQADWARQLHEEWLQSESGLASWRLSEAKANSINGAGTAEEYAIKANQTSANRALKYDSGTGMWIDEDEGWYEGVYYNAESNLYEYDKYTSKQSRDDAKKAEEQKKAAIAAKQAQRIGVGSWVRANPSALIYRSSGGANSGQGGGHQYFDDDPYYIIMEDCGNSWKVQHRSYAGTGEITGYFNKKDLYAYETGGLVKGTGLAWLDGTPQRPEFVLNADQTQAFMKLVDKLGSGVGAGDNYFDINIVVDELSSDYDVDKMVDRIKQKITEDAQYRNVNAINWIR